MTKYDGFYYYDDDGAFGRAKVEEAQLRIQDGRRAVALDATEGTFHIHVSLRETEPGSGDLTGTWQYRDGRTRGAFEGRLYERRDGRLMILGQYTDPSKSGSTYEPWIIELDPVEE